jgi:hypothetical protein
MKRLYTFTRMHNLLTEWGFPEKNSMGGYRLIKGIDFEKAFKEGSISFEEDGIYLELDGKKYKGYMFIKYPYIERHKSFPKFHVVKCQTIQGFIAEGRFKVRYEWANTNKVDLIDFDSKNIYKDQELQLCHNCQQKILDDIRTTEEFYALLDTSEIEKDIEVDIRGYVKNFHQISKAFRQSVDFTCESCGIKPKNNIDKLHWHVHHKDGNKINNKIDNLQCLCELCHANTDDHHKQNFQKKKMNISLNNFIRKYQTELIACKNPYI